MLPLIMIIAAPVLQIVLSTLRIAGLINKPIGVIAALSFVAGILLSALSVSIVNSDITAGSSATRCGTAGAAFLICGVVITIIFIPLIGLICGAIYKATKKEEQTKPPEVIYFK